MTFLNDVRNACAPYRTGVAVPFTEVKRPVYHLLARLGWDWFADGRVGIPRAIRERLRRKP